MPLVIGTSLGPYLILAPLGSGGMGDVYRARDTRLNRQVAIKVLREPFAADSGRRLRLAREARILSQITHPHICTVHDVGEHDGATYLVLELLDGETLADRLERSRPRPLPLKEGLAIAIDVAEALDAAHRRGIVHRDLKPSNVMLTKSGTKLLDFGIAKVTRVLFESSAPFNGTAGQVLDTVTAEGALLGTLQYAAPEQLEGQAADARSDVFSFGAILYEMLAGRLAFDGESQSKVIAAVLEHEPPLGALTPSALARIVQKCLAKDPERRWQTARDLADELKWVGDLDPAKATPSAAPSWWREAIPIAAGALVAAGLTSAVWWSLGSPAPAHTISRFTIPLGEGQQFPPPVHQLVAISPDGTQMVYPANHRVYLRSMSDLDGKPIPGTEESGPVETPVFSPDGRSIVFYSDRDQALKKIAVSGGSAVTLCSSGLPNGLIWGASGILYGQAWSGWDDRGILRISPDGGKPEVLIAVKNDEAAASPQFLPDGETVLFTLLRGEAFDRWDKAHIVVQSLKSGRRTTLIEGGSDGRYLPSGHIVYARDGVLFAIPFDARRLQVTGGPVPMLEGVNRSGANGVAAWSLADNGTLLYVLGPAPSTDRRGLALSDGQGVVEPLNVPLAANLAPRISPDGKWIAVTVDDEREANIWLYDREGTSPGRRLTYGGQNRFAVWSPDGRRLVFQSDREGDQGLFWQLANGTGAAERLTKAEFGTFHVAESFSPRSEHLLYRVSTPSKRFVMMLSIKDKKTTLFLEEGTFSTFSPDGRWVAYTHREGSAFPLVVQPFPATGAKYQVWANGYHARWSRDGKELFGNTGPPYRFEAVTITTQPTFAFSRPVQMFLPVVGVGAQVVNYDIMPDGQHFLILTSPDGYKPIPPLIQVVLNWTEELKRRVAER
jgi:eukaryotic-like serine/threonine-protein kinase